MEASPANVVHVLAVDDDPSARQLIADYLGHNDIRVTALESGKQIREVMDREAIDLLVLDLRLPGEDGMEIARSSAKTSPACRSSCSPACGTKRTA